MATPLERRKSGGDAPDEDDVRGSLTVLTGPFGILVAASFVGSMGIGIYSSGVAVYFNTVVGLPPNSVAVGLSAAGLLWFTLAIPCGVLADRFGPREAAVFWYAVQFLTLLTVPLATSFSGYLAVALVLGIAENAANVSRGALIAQIFEQKERVRLSAYLQTTFNLGFTIGIGLSGFAMAAGSPQTYKYLFWGDAIAAGSVAVLLLRISRVSSKTGNQAGRHPVRLAISRGRMSYFLVAVLCGLVGLTDSILTVGMPLWIVRETSAPKGVAAWAIGVNTVLVMALQVRASRGADSRAGALRLLRAACIANIVACAVFALAHYPHAWGAVATLVVGVLLLTLAELWTTPATWYLRYSLAQAEAQGRSGGVFAMGTSIRVTVGPVLVTTFAVEWGAAGWLVVIGVFATLFGALGPATRWAATYRADSESIS